MPILEHWVIKLIGLAEMVKLIVLSEKNKRTFLKRLEPLYGLFAERRKKMHWLLWDLGIKNEMKKRKNIRWQLLCRKKGRRHNCLCGFFPISCFSISYFLSSYFVYFITLKKLIKKREWSSSSDAFYGKIM